MAFLMELELHELELHAILKKKKKTFTYSCVSWRPIVAFLMELEFHANFFLIIIIFLSLTALYSIFYKSSFTLKLDSKKIEFQNRDISLISLGKGTKH